ncbi:MAG: toprim domain-containing protein [Thermoproteota archaeon]|nr:toprim domain-containing protein [Thermoproteota archaeon]
MDEATIAQLRLFVDRLNTESEEGSVIVVEGKRDVEALTSIGCTGQVTPLNRFKGINNFVDSQCNIDKKIILLLDMDRTGKYLTSKLLKQLQSRGGNVSLFYKKSLARISNGKIRHIEDLISYAPLLSGITDARKDLFMYT